MAYISRQFQLVLPAVILSAFALTAAQAQNPFTVKTEGSGFLGVYPTDLEDEDREALGLEGVEGVLIEDIVSDGPAAKAGIKAGDVIIKLGRESLAGADDLRKVLRSSEAGDEIEVTVLRKGTEETVKVKLEERPEETRLFAHPKVVIHERDEEGGFLGVESITLKEQLAGHFKVKGGVLVEEVEEDSPAEKAGIKAGDIILKVGDDEIASSEELYRAVRSHEPEESVKINIIRDGKGKTVEAALGKAPAAHLKGEGSRRLVIQLDDEEFDIGQLKETIKEALKDIDIDIHFDREEFMRSMDELREELKKMKQELKELKEKRSQSD